jgi:hypothetical protein
MKRITIAVDRKIYERFKILTVLQKKSSRELVEGFMLSYLKKHKEIVQLAKI